MSLFRGFSPFELTELKNRAKIAVLSEQLALTNQALEAVSAELREVQLKLVNINKHTKPED